MNNSNLTNLTNLRGSPLFPSYFDNYLTQTGQSEFGHFFEEDDNNCYLSIDMPGIYANEIDVEVKNDTLSVRAKRVINASDKTLSKDYNFKSNIPNYVDQEAIKVFYENGVLNFIMPKNLNENSKVKKLKVNNSIKNDLLKDRDSRRQ